MVNKISKELKVVNNPIRVSKARLVPTKTKTSNAPLFIKAKLVTKLIKELPFRTIELTRTSITNK